MDSVTEDLAALKRDVAALKWYVVVGSAVVVVMLGAVLAALVRGR